MSEPPLVLAITGASGAPYARRLLDVWLTQQREVHVTMSAAAVHVFREELGVEIELQSDRPAEIVAKIVGRDPEDDVVAGCRYHSLHDFSAGIASGSFRTGGMVICPCSIGTLGCIANGISSNLIHRAADVHLKERRKLIVVPRETPLGAIALSNMARLTDAGGIVLPAMPGFYHRPQSIGDLVDFIVQRICDQLDVEIDLSRRWGGS